jgi:MFS transporter, FHS family, L-fucose permease
MSYSPQTEKNPRSGAKKSIFVTPDGRNLAFTFALVTSLFFIWGFCNGMIDQMDKHFQMVLHLNLSQSAWVQFAHYLGYFLMALPAGAIASRLGYKGGIIAGLLMVAAGGLWFIPASHIGSFWAYLLGVCAVAAGLTFLETVANPYTTVLGNQQYAATRINLAQSTNGIGSLLGPIAGGIFFYSKNTAGQDTGSQTLYIPYLAVAITVLLLAAVFYFAEVPDIKVEDDYHLDDKGAVSDSSRSIWSHRHFVAAIGAQFFYVAAQAGIFSFLINYISGTNDKDSQVPAIPDAWNHGWLAGKLVLNHAGVLQASSQLGSYMGSIGMLCFLTGRLSGSWLLNKKPAHSLLGLYGVLNAVMCLLIFLKLGWLSVICVFMTYFFMSIMFPTIFALGIHGLGARAKFASAYIVMAILGGALVPKLMGFIADKTDLSRGFIVPLVCFAFVAWYGYMWPKLSGSESLGRSPLVEH